MTTRNKLKVGDWVKTTKDCWVRQELFGRIVFADDSLVPYLVVVDKNKVGILGGAIWLYEYNVRLLDEEEANLAYPHFLNARAEDFINISNHSP